MTEERKQELKEKYTGDIKVINSWESSDECADGYEICRGPWFECCITEPEDRIFSRDLSDLVDALRTAQKDIQELLSEICTER
jgi:hypothetical protein